MKKAFLLGLGFFLVSFLGYSQTYELETRNFTQVDETKIQWEVWLNKGSGSEDFSLWQMQVRWRFNEAILNGGTLSTTFFTIEAGDTDQRPDWFKDEDCVVSGTQLQWITEVPEAGHPKTLITDVPIKIATFQIQLEKNGQPHNFANADPQFAFFEADPYFIRVWHGAGSENRTDRAGITPAIGENINDRELASHAFYGTGDWSTPARWNNTTNENSEELPDAGHNVLVIAGADADFDVASLTLGELTLQAKEVNLPVVTTGNHNPSFWNFGNFQIDDNEVVSEGDEPVTARGIIVGDNADITSGNADFTYPHASGGVGTFNIQVDLSEMGAHPHADLWFRAYATSILGTAYGDAKQMPSAGKSNFDEVVVKNATKDPSISVAKLTIAAGTQLTVTNLYNDTDDAANLVLESPAGHGAAGSLIHSNTNVPVSVQRYIARWEAGESQDVDGWHLLSAPVSGQDIVPEFFPAGPGDEYDAVDFYRWDEATRSWLNIKTGTFTHTEFQVGHGYLMAYGAPAKDTWGNRTHTFAGPANVVSITFDNLDFTGAETYTGWHLLGNPFASALNWNNETDWNLTAAGSPHVWDDTANDYKEIATTDVIPAMNGLMIKVTNATNSITLNPANRVHSPQDWYKHQERDDRIRLLARDPSLNSAKGSTVIFREDALAGMDRYDSYLISGFGPIFFSQVDQVRVSVNALPEYHDGLTIPFGFTRNPASRGTEFSIELESKLKELEDAGYLLHLHDLKLDVQHNLSQEPVYEFTWQEGDDVNRFLLVFEELDVTGIDEPLPGDVGLGNAWLYDNMLYVYSVEDGTQVALYDLSGRMLQSWRAQAGQQGRYVDLPSGVYVVRMTGSTATKSVKVVVR